MKKFLLLLVLLFNISLPYTSLYVQDPRGWGGGPGTIEEALVSIKPLGIYTQTELYLTFSARGLQFSNYDTLEVQFYFDLPDNAIVTDSWLWMNQDTIKAKIMDQWTASSIYESIVKRRRDPSILFKRGATQYELRIFPLPGDKTRKVKITYLVPAQWNSSIVTTPIPANLLRVSQNQLNKFDLNVYLSENWTNPQVVELPAITFQNIIDTVAGNHFKAVIPEEAIQTNLTFGVNAPFHNGIFVSTYQKESEGIYQMAFLPSKVLNISEPKKAAILIDYEPSMSNISKTDLLNNLKLNIQSNFSEKDSFNLIFSKVNINRISENWIQADSAVIDSIFKELGEDEIAEYSNLPSLLADGINFIKTHGNDGNILLVANSDENGDFMSANELISDLLSLMDPILPITVVNFQNQNYSYHWLNGQYYWGNEYFYTNITRLTSGNYFSLLNSTASFSDLLSSAFQSLSGYISSFDLHTKLENGFCYARYNLDLNSSSIPLNKPILQIGKFQGDFPFVIEASGIYKTNPFSEKFTLEDSMVFQSDSLNEEMWGGNFIKFLEGQTQSNEIINEIVYTSVSKRILSIYSAFICLEPSFEDQVCYDCENGGEIIIGIADDSLKQDKNDSLMIAAYPNPFNSQINLRVKIPSKINSKDISFKIYNILGQLVKTFEPSIASREKEIRITWNGKNDGGNYVSSGNYFFVVATPDKVNSTKIVLLK